VDDGRAIDLCPEDPAPLPQGMAESLRCHFFDGKSVQDEGGTQGSDARGTRYAQSGWRESPRGSRGAWASCWDEDAHVAAEPNACSLGESHVAVRPTLRREGPDDKAELTHPPAKRLASQALHLLRGNRLVSQLSAGRRLGSAAGREQPMEAYTSSTTPSANYTEAMADQKLASLPENGSAYKAQYDVDTSEAYPQPPTRVDSIEEGCITRMHSAGGDVRVQPALGEFGACEDKENWHVSSPPQKNHVFPSTRQPWRSSPSSSSVRGDAAGFSVEDGQPEGVCEQTWPKELSPFVKDHKDGLPTSPSRQSRPRLRPLTSFM